MTKYREILRLHSLGFSQQNIAYSSNVSKKTVNRVINRAKELNISWPLDDNQTDAVLEQILFSKSKTDTVKKMPDFAYIRKELLKNRVSKKLIWTEYIMNKSLLKRLATCEYISRKQLQQNDEMRLTAMADAYHVQISDHFLNELSFEDEIDIEYRSRKKQIKKTH